LRQQERTYEALAIELRSKVRLAATRLLSAQRMALYYQNTVLPLQADIMSQSQLYYNGMLLGPFDLLLLRQNQIDTRRDAIGSIREYWTERSELDRLTGIKTTADETPAGKVSP
jgi:cobalt-zinc-cadmium efflux system outer membrane protein